LIFPTFSSIEHSNKRPELSVISDIKQNLNGDLFTNLQQHWRTVMQLNMTGTRPGFVRAEGPNFIGADVCPAVADHSRVSIGKYLGNKVQLNNYFLWKELINNPI
jgi:hypothetical protein